MSNLDSEYLRLSKLKYNKYLWDLKRLRPFKVDLKNIWTLSFEVLFQELFFTNEYVFKKQYLIIAARWVLLHLLLEMVFSEISVCSELFFPFKRSYEHFQEL